MLSMQTFYTRLVSRPGQTTAYKIFLLRLCSLSRAQLLSLRPARRWEIWG